MARLILFLLPFAALALAVAARVAMLRAPGLPARPAPSAAPAPHAPEAPVPSPLRLASFALLLVLLLGVAAGWLGPS